MKQKRIISDLSGDTGRVIDAREIGGNGSSVTVDSALSNSSTNPVENKVVNKAVQDLREALTGKVSVSQGAANAGKFLIVGSDGNITPVAMPAWQGGSY